MRTMYMKWNSPKTLISLALCLSYHCAVAQWNDKVRIVIPNGVCKSITLKDGNSFVPVTPKKEGDYELLASDDNLKNTKVGDVVPTAYYTCHNSKSEAPAFNVSHISGTFAKIDPTAWINPVWGGVGFYEDQNPVPCNGDFNIAYATSPSYMWCDKLGNTGSNGGKDNLNRWWVHTPNIQINAGWKNIYLSDREWGTDNGWNNPNDGVAISLTYSYN